VAEVAGSRPRQILFRYTGVDENYAHYGKLTIVDVTSLDRPRFVDAISCEAVHFAAGHGICLSTRWGSYPSYFARVFDGSFKESATFPLKGSPSRTRVSPDGTLAAFTVFLSSVRNLSPTR